MCFSWDKMLLSSLKGKLHQLALKVNQLVGFSFVAASVIRLYIASMSPVRIAAVAV